MFHPSRNLPMHIAVFGSGTGSILRAMLNFQARTPHCPFSIQLLYTDRVCGFQEIASEKNLILIHNPWDSSISREEYDRRGLALLRGAETPIDVLLLAGYMRLMSEVWLSAFPQRILNIHPADLTQLDAQGNRKFIGAHSVFHALTAGEKQTRTSAILIDRRIDGGPILISGPWVPYLEGYPVTLEKAKKHQERQKKISDWPTCLAALVLLAQGRFALSKDAVMLDGKQLASCGFDMNEEKDVWNYWDLKC